MASIQIDVSGIQAGLDAFQEAYERGIARGLAVLADRIAAFLRGNCPVRTGTTRRHIVARYDAETRRGLLIVAFPAALWWRRNVVPNHPRVSGKAIESWARANALQIIAREVRAELATLQGG